MTIWVSHRGESYDAPENTLAAFRLALERDTDAWETDIRFTRDKQLICCHDASLHRTCGVEQEVAETDFEQLRTFDACNSKEAYRGEQVPLFSELLALLPQGKLLFTEIKINDPDIVDAMMEAIDNSPAEREQIIVISFYADMIKVCKERYPDMRALYLNSMTINEDGSFAVPPEEMLERLADMHADGLDARAEKKYLTPEFAKKLADRGFSLALWTIDDPDTAEYFINTIAPEAITSNRAAYLQNVIDHGQSR
ncbi:MAG: hypothetical protein IKC65_03695 [Lentisphaeria bacterium]|nr:hypothetical protein [Lentisphaeria bacterium]